ncbi:DNA invertase Pin-like site-specific DNA recombinase [Mesobacillus stamsii]|uniref:DNA invertase Pin-like site-specific DNA recombinase n=2 Tax=Mesobacillus stamsii TaxID=225347 RepID=A0ABU0FQ51_9BACI|nr:DNA invertase Pin-like site-specific DNA recombinase [Mesobacillus stamsii]
MENKIRAWTSYRVSTDRQGAEGDDIPMQSSQCHAFADKMGWTIEKELTEKLSGYKTAIEDRDTLKVIKAGAEAKEFDVLLVYHSDRLGRQMEYSLWIASLYELGVKVWSVKEGELKNQEHGNALMNFIRYWQSEGESKKTSMRVKDAMQQLNEEGYYLGGTIPFGYQIEDTGEKRNSKKDKTVKKLVINPNEAKIVKLIFDWTIERSMGGSTIAQELNGMELTNRGKLWRHNTITRMMRNPIYMGYKKYNTTEFVGARTKKRKETKRDEWQLQPFNQELVIIPEEQFKKVQDIMDKRVKKTGASSENRTPTNSNLLLSGFAVCGYCGHKLKADFTNKKNVRVDGSVQEYRTYRYTCHHARNTPEGHKQRAFGAVTIDKQVEQEVLLAVNSINLDAFNAEKDAFDFKEIDTRKIQLKELEQQKEETVKSLANVEKLFDDIMSGKSKISLDFVSNKMEEYYKKKEELNKKIDALKKDIEEVEVTSSDLDKLKQQLKNWVENYQIEQSLEKRKVMMAQVVREVAISKEALLIKFNITIEKALENSFLPINDSENKGWSNVPTGTGTGGPGYTIKCETEGNPHKHVPGSLSMAHAGKDTGGSQFFIVHESQPHLNGVHTVFGKVTSNLEAAKAMSNGDVMEKVVVTEG